MVQGKCFIVEIGGLCSIKFNCLFESLQCLIVLLILEVTEAEIVLGGGVILDCFTSFGQICNRFTVFFDLSVAITSVEESLEVCFSSFDIF